MLCLPSGYRHQLTGPALSSLLQATGATASLPLVFNWLSPFVLFAGKWGYYAAWLYLSTCMAVFLVRTLKRAVFQEVRNYGEGVGEKLGGSLMTSATPLHTFVSINCPFDAASCAWQAKT